jgi:hypothetical protein
MNQRPARGENRREVLRANLAVHGETVRRMYVDEDLSQAKIAKAIGVNQATIGHWLVALGIPSRSTARTGDKNGRYKDGSESRAYMKLVDRSRCARCEATTDITVHHKDGDHRNDERSNLEPRCRSGHSRQHKKAYWASQPKKTHCVHGHPLTGNNLYVNRKGHRGCKTCRKAASARQYTRRTAQGLSP